MREEWKAGKEERLKLARAAQDKEADFRRERRWRVFSWASSLLLGSIAGAVVLVGKEGRILPLIPHKLLIIAALGVLATCAVLWINYSGTALDIALSNVKKIDEALGLYEGIKIEEPRGHRVSYGIIVLLLAAVAATIVLLPSAGEGNTDQKQQKEDISGQQRPHNPGLAADA